MEDWQKWEEQKMRKEKKNIIILKRKRVREKEGERMKFNGWKLKGR